MLTEFKAIQFGYMLIYSFHQGFKILRKFYVWLPSKKIKVYQAFHYSIYCLAALPARSQVDLPSKRGHVSPTTCHTGLHYISHLMDGDFSNPGYLQGILSSNRATHQLSLSILPYWLHQPGGCYWAHGNLFSNRSRS